MDQDPENTDITDEVGQDQSRRKSTGQDNRVVEVRRAAQGMIDRGERVTIEAIRDHLRSLDRGYSLNTDQISRALASRYASGKIERYSNGKRVQVDRTTYRSIRQAAEAHGIAVNTVRKRVASKSKQFRGWRYTDG